MDDEVTEDIDDIVSKVMQIHLGMIRWNVKYMSDLFDINGKKPDILTRTQMELLKIIDSIEKVTISQLGKIMCVSKSSISITVSRMETYGYVTRYKDGDETDGRKTFLEITEKGKIALENIEKKMFQGFANYYKSMNEEDKENLKNGIDCFYKIYVNREE